MESKPSKGSMAMDALAAACTHKHTRSSGRSRSGHEQQQPAHAGTTGAASGAQKDMRAWQQVAHPLQPQAVMHVIVPCTEVGMRSASGRFADARGARCLIHTKTPAAAGKDMSAPEQAVTWCMQLGVELKRDWTNDLAYALRTACLDKHTSSSSGQRSEQMGAGNQGACCVKGVYSVELEPSRVSAMLLMLGGQSIMGLT
eukprot:1149828-Pelagomonas_calceolata.AAC.2